ncbi:MAG: polysaccharide biosynthesis/export family protein [Pseudomonadota bacterium]
MTVDTKTTPPGGKQRAALLVLFAASLFLAAWVFQGTCPAQTASYQIGPRDILTLTIHAAGETQSQVDLTVSDHGTINVPFIRTVNIEGRTISELENLIAEALTRDYFVNPQVIIHINTDFRDSFNRHIDIRFSA